MSNTPSGYKYLLFRFIENPMYLSNSYYGPNILDSQ
jgi:hypothetical protein